MCISLYVAFDMCSFLFKLPVESPECVLCGDLHIFGDQTFKESSMPQWITACVYISSHST